MRVQAEIEINAPREAVWAWVSDPSRHLEFMSGITRWEVVGDTAQGKGTRIQMLMLVGAAEMGGLVEIVESDEPGDLAWTSILGVDQRGRWRLRTRGQRRAQRTHVELRLAYGVAGAGPAGWLSERLAAPTVRNHLRRSLHQLKRLVEHEQRRELAASRRARVA